MSTAATSASRADAHAPRSRPSGPHDRFEEVLSRARRSEGRRAPPAGVRPAPRPARMPARAAPGESGEPGRDARPVAPGVALAGPERAPPPGILELQAAVRAAPPAIAAALREAQPQLALHFGSALSIDLRAGAQGLELSLRPSATLERAARAELPGLVEALRAHGLRVARAEIRPGPGKQGPPERVDGSRRVR